MRNMHKGFCISLLMAIGIAAGYYFVLSKPVTHTQQPTEQKQPSETQLTILVPENLDAYEKAMNTYTSDGGANPADTWPFVQKIVTVPYTTGTIRASAEAAAEQLSTGGGPAHASVAYFKIKDSVAYVLLNIDLDGWAGVSFSINRIHPLVEKTLLQFPQIHSVTFGYAPGDSQTSTTQ